MHSTNQPASAKRTSFPLKFDYTNAFEKDWKRLSHAGKFNMRRLKEVMALLIANDGPLGPEWLDHTLQGDWVDHRECHVGGDFLLIYQIDEDHINFARSGTHSELFG